MCCMKPASSAIVLHAINRLDIQLPLYAGYFIALPFFRSYLEAINRAFGPI